MKKPLTIILTLTAVLLIGIIIVFNIQRTANPSLGPYVKINNKIIKVLIADEPAEQTRGLSDRPRLEADQGMLFIFPKSQIRSFWMKNMRFPIDIIWIEDNKIINISKNLPPEGQQPQNHYSSDKPANYVLEVNAGFVEEHSIEVADKIIFNLKFLLNV